METFISIIVSLMTLVLFPFMGLFMGLISLVTLNSFTWLYVAVLGLLFTVQIKIPKNIRDITITALSLGVIMMWISLFISYQELSDAYNLSKPVATGGFPVAAFEYPPGALGNNIPPIDSWGLFYLNLGFWIIIGTGIAMLLRKHLNKQASYIFLVASIIISIYGLGYILIKFD